jgi:hypothetical protein
MKSEGAEILSASQVMELFGISRITLWRRVYQEKSIPAHTANNARPGRKKNGARRSERLIFKRDEIMAMIKPVQVDSERKMKRAAKKKRV